MKSERKCLAKRNRTLAIQAAAGLRIQQYKRNLVFTEPTTPAG